MYKNGLKTIAVLAGDIQTEYTSQVCKRVFEKADEIGYNVAVFNWTNPYGQQPAYLKGEVDVFNLVNFSEFDAAIYLKDTIGIVEVETMIEDKIDKFLNGPVISIRNKVDGYYNILTKDEAGIAEVIRHFIEVHKCTKIAYLSGRKELLDAQLRLETYKRVMDEYGLEYDESYIYHGNYWVGCVADALEYLLSSPLGVPEVIVCANDYMAIETVKELIVRGYKVPDEIKVSGFDNISEAVELMPALTTVDAPIINMAEKAVDMIHDIFCGYEVEKEVIFDAVPVIRDTCGCGGHDYWDSIVKKTLSRKAGFDFIGAQRNLRFFNVALETTNKLSDIATIVDGYLYSINNFKNFFLCLSKEPKCDDLDNVYSTDGNYTKKSLCALALLDRAHTGEYPFIFDTNEMIPAIYTTKEPQLYYFSPIHLLEKNYGYVAVNCYDYESVPINFDSFTTHISNALDSLYNKRELEQALRNVESLYVTDPLTGLYNRRGFEMKAEEVFEGCRKDNVPLMVMGIDMDGLKYINDTFGHLQGDIAIQLLGRALSYASSGREVCARVGGDEFSVIAGNYTEEDVKTFVASVYDFLDSYNMISDAPYDVKASYGYIYVDEYDDEKNLEYYIKASDDLMYQQKAGKKRGR